ncbi:hypothetical protein HUB98_21915 [Paenibacillus barcinonensis]|uniref:SUKH-4 immunity protein of toxin-antitoxin system n=1 Tax=Paenibacillus barcinonensis TaxID=198119 RepID=A0ABX6QDL4_PAEBA|nr:hypothetical protein HUB98_21915 [Paenibacillus barcinonensis]
MTEAVTVESLEIILLDFKKSNLDQFIKKDLSIQTNQIRSSHFYDNSRGKDTEFQDITSFEEILSPKGTGNLFLSDLNLGHNFIDVMIVFSFDEQYGDITMNFPEEELYSGEKSETALKAEGLIRYIFDMMDKYEIKKVRVGYEPATDDDTCLVEINKETKNFNDIVTKLLG